MQAWYWEARPHRDRFQDERLSLRQQHLSLSKYRTEQRGGPEKGHTKPYAKPGCLSPPYTHLPPCETHTILNSSGVREMQFQETRLIDFLPQNNPDLVKCYCFHIISVDIFINIPPADSGMLSRNVWQINESCGGPAKDTVPEFTPQDGCFREALSKDSLTNKP